MQVFPEMYNQFEITEGYSNNNFLIGVLRALDLKSAEIYISDVSGPSVALQVLETDKTFCPQTFS